MTGMIVRAPAFSAVFFTFPGNRSIETAYHGLPGSF
jgi:hypothetical protein